MSFYYYEKTWQELKEYIEQDALVILPVGTTEEHGPHLPVETDAMISEAFGAALGRELEGRIPVLVMRSVFYGYSMGCIQAFPGTISIRSEVVQSYVFDIVDSLCRMGFSKIVLLDCHGNHDGILRNVMRGIVDKYGRYIGVIKPSKLSGYEEIKRDPEGDIHAGEYETSLIWALHPDTVHPDKFSSVDAIRLDKSLLGPVSTWGLQQTEEGSFGDPTFASRELGEAVLEMGAKRMADWCVRYDQFFRGKCAKAAE